MLNFRLLVRPLKCEGLTPATASYRLLPTIDIISPITGEDAEKFVKCFPAGVAAVKKRSNGVKYAEVVNPRLDTVSREVLRHEEFQKKVKLGRVRDHFICTRFLPLVPQMIFLVAHR